MPLKRITVLLAEDHTIVRQGLRRLLEAEDDIAVIGEAQTGRQAVQLTQKLLPAVVVMDIAMPLLNGLEATRQILRVVPATKVLILSAHHDDEYIKQVSAVGAAGYLIKQTSVGVLSKGIREVEKGNIFFGPIISRRFYDHKSFDPRTPFKKKGIGLRSREVEILQLISEGKANKQIAAELFISIKTVEKHRQHLMNKLEIHDIAGLTRYAIAAGITESGVQLTII
jgi:DNA-binding NarL/FixJ family response regulator